MDRKYKVNIDSDKENDEENNNKDDDKFDPIPIENTSSKLLLVYQSPNVKRLLDATYKTCKCSLFLFFLDIQTNVNYQVAAAFVTQEETFEMLSQVLQIIKGTIFLFIMLYFKYTLNQETVYTDIILCRYNTLFKNMKV